jgi:hypothetical protein
MACSTSATLMRLSMARSCILVTIPYCLLGRRTLTLGCVPSILIMSILDMTSMHCAAMSYSNVWTTVPACDVKGELLEAKASELACTLQGCHVSLHRCGASMLVCRNVTTWQCQLCGRSYSPSHSNFLLWPPTCLYCGVAFGPLLPKSFLRWPGLQP